MNSYINHIPANIKNSAFPLAKLDLKRLEGIQKDIPLFDGVNLEDISFLAKRLETLNLFRGCRVNCSHCLKDAKPPVKGRETILYEDLTRFLDGFKELSGRLGINVLQGKNLKEQSELIEEALEWQMMSPQERRKTLFDCSVKCVDIDGSVYATMPSLRTEHISAPIELTVPANIQLNYENKTPAGKVFSDIELD